MKVLKLKDLPIIERPREKLVKYGPEKLSNTELLAIILRTGRKGRHVLGIADGLLKTFPENKLADATFTELKNRGEIGQAASSEIVACFELGKRLLKDKKTTLVLTPHDVWQELKDIRESKKEHFVIFYLDARNQAIAQDIISVGIVDTNLVHAREVFEPAVKHLAVHIIVAHNHPSGTVEPSDQDIRTTQRLVEAGKVLGIGILDHVIVSKETFFSFKEHNLLTHRDLYQVGQKVGY